MSLAIGLSGGLSISDGSSTISGQVSKSITGVGTQFIASVQNIGTTTEALNLGDVTTPGYFFFKNQDPTNIIRIGLATPVTSGNCFAEVLPGEGFPLPSRQTVIYAIALVAACDLYFEAAEV